MITISESMYVYTVWDFIAEFGGWVGIFLGYCVADVVNVLEVILEILHAI